MYLNICSICNKTDNSFINFKIIFLYRLYVRVDESPVIESYDFVLLIVSKPINDWLTGWVFRFNGPSRQGFSLYPSVSKKRSVIGERKKSNNPTSICCNHSRLLPYYFPNNWGWSGGAKMLGKLSVPGRPATLD